MMINSSSETVLRVSSQGLFDNLPEIFTLRIQNYFPDSTDLHLLQNLLDVVEADLVGGEAGDKELVKRGREIGLLQCELPDRMVRYLPYNF